MLLGCEAGKAISPAPEALWRFEKYVARGEGCWLWRGGRTASGEYGKFRLRGRHISAHRAAYAIYVGEVPAGLVVMHSCDNGLCVNPAHLSVDLQLANVADMVAKGRAKHVTGDALRARTHCKNGHEFTPENTRATPRARICRICVRGYIRRYRQRQKAAPCS